MTQDANTWESSQLRVATAARVPNWSKSVSGAGR